MSTANPHLRRDYDRIAIMEENIAGMEQEAQAIELRMLQRSTERFIKAGYSPEEAHDRAVAALYSPSKIKLPTIDELDG